MTRADFEEAVRAARGWSATAVSSVRIFRPQVAQVTARKGLYFALDLYGELDYIGSAARAEEGGLADRVLKHTNPAARDGGRSTCCRSARRRRPPWCGTLRATASADSSRRVT